MSNNQAEISRLVSRQEELELKNQNHGLSPEEEAEFKSNATELTKLNEEAVKANSKAKGQQPKQEAKKQEPVAQPKKEEAELPAVVQAMLEEMKDLKAANKALMEKLAAGESVTREEFGKNWAEYKEVELTRNVRFRVFNFDGVKHYPVGMKYSHKVKTEEDGVQDVYNVDFVTEKNEKVTKPVVYKAFCLSDETELADIINVKVSPLRRELGTTRSISYVFYADGKGAERVRAEVGDVVPLVETRERRVYTVKLQVSGITIEVEEGGLNL